jgi:AGCS family alanine or glycine:cation symporter
MVGLYCVSCVGILLLNFDRVPASLGLIFRMAFTENALYGGLVGVLVQGVRRAAFSNEAGIGSASIAHAAAKTDEPVREGLVAMLGPVIDTVIVCLMTALVVVVTGAWNDPTLREGLSGVQVTAVAFERQISWSPYVLALCVVMFAYSTMISWSYYGERGWVYLLDHFGGRGRETLIVYRVVFVLFVFVGAVTKLEQVLDFSDLMILAMAFPNIVGSVLLAPRVLPLVLDYWHRYTSGQMKATS